MASKTLFTYLAVICVLMYSVADAMVARHIARRDAGSVEAIQSRSQQLKARMSDIIQGVESEIQSRSETLATQFSNGLEKMIDAATRMLVEHVQASEAAKSAKAAEAAISASAQKSQA